jgi:hypothetical protein
MARKRSVFEYEAVSFNKVDLGTGPVTQITEMNDGYQIVLAGKNCQRIGSSDSQDERGGIQVKVHDTFRDYLVEEFGAEVQEDGTVEFFGDETTAEVLERLSNDGDPVMGGGLLQVTKLMGNYRNPVTLFQSFWDGEEDEEDED